MKKSALLILFLSFNYFTRGQNLIQNPDFELYQTCPTGIGQVNKAIDWISVICTPDYFNCSFTSHNDFPTTSLAYSGTGCMGFLSYGDANGSGEAFGQHLSQPLIPNNSYSISFAAKRPYQGMYANNCGGVGVYGSKYTVPNDTCFIHASQIPNAVLLASTLTIQNTNWNTFTLNFNVTDTINYIVFTIGQSPSCMEYIFVDSTSLVSLGPSSVNETGVNNHFSIFPNPSDGHFTIILPGDYNEVLITNVLGQVVTSIQSEPGEIDLNIDDDGIYFVTVKTGQGISTRKIIVKQ